MDYETLHAYLAREVGDADLRDLLDQIVCDVSAARSNSPAILARRSS